MGNNPIQQSTQPYSALSHIYDYVMSHVNYSMWANYIKALLKLADHRITKLADLSCGTGSILPYLQNFRRQVFGFDLSFEMLTIAKQKNKKLPLICSDFRRLPVKSIAFDAALSLYDSVNYLMTDQDVLKFLSEAYRILRPGGVLIFDVVTPYICQTAFKKYQEKAVVKENLKYDRMSFFKEHEQIQVNQFHIWLNGTYFFEEHQQKIRTIKHWVQLVKQSNFKLLEIFSNFSMKPVTETSERAHFVLKRLMK